MAGLVFRTAWGNLADYDGQQVLAIAITSDFPFNDAGTVDMEFVDEITAWEVDTADAPDYLRPAFEAEFVQEGDEMVLRVATGENPTADLAGAPDHAGWAFADATAGTDATRALISVLPIAGGAGLADSPILDPDGIAVVKANALEQLAAEVAPLIDDLPEPSSGTDGQVWTNTGGTSAGWADPFTIDPTDGTNGQVWTTNGTTADWQDAAGGLASGVNEITGTNFGGGYYGYTLPATPTDTVQHLVAPVDVDAYALVVVGETVTNNEWLISVPPHTWATSGVLLHDGVAAPVPVTVIGTEQTDFTDGALIHAWGDGTTWFAAYHPAPVDLTALQGEIDAAEGNITTLTNRLNRYYPSTPTTPHLHVSKYVTFDPDFPLDGTATHVGGQLIENGQNLTILDNSTGNGGVWTLSTSGAATRASGFGSMIDSDIGNYDHVSYTGTRWAYFAMFRLYGDATTMGMAPVPPDHDGIFGGEGTTRSYRPDLIATDLTGDNLTVLEADGSTTVVSVAAQTGLFCVLVLDTVEMVTIDEGVVEQTEDFSSADGLWIAQGWGGNGIGAVAAVGPNGATVLTGQPYTPGNGTHWANPDPATVQDALDRLAAAVYADTSNTPIP